jgi:hypothetical protein
VDPLSLVATLSGGATVAAGAGAAAGLTEVVKRGVVEAYTACKRAIRTQFGDDEDAKEKLAQLEVRPDDPVLQEAVAGFLQTHRADEDAVVTEAAEALRVQLARIQSGTVSMGDVTDTMIIADRGGIAGVNITGGAAAGYTAPSGGTDPQ